MKSKLIFSFSIFILFLIFINYVSAEGLCMGNDGYYHDCDDNRYFDRYDRNYDDYYYYHGNYYPTRDYYYRDYYRPRYNRYDCDDNELTYKDTEEYTRTTEYNYEDRGVSENIKYTINEKTETNLKYDSYYLRNMMYNDYYNQDADNNQDYHWYDFFWDVG